MTIDTKRLRMLLSAAAPGAYYPVIPRQYKDLILAALDELPAILDRLDRLEDLAKSARLVVRHNEGTVDCSNGECYQAVDKIFYNDLEEALVRLDKAKCPPHN